MCCWFHSHVINSGDRMDEAVYSFELIQAFIIQMPANRVIFYTLHS
jgi:hypothetical protein